MKSASHHWFRLNPLPSVERLLLPIYHFAPFFRVFDVLVDCSILNGENVSYIEVTEGYNDHSDHLSHHVAPSGESKYNISELLC